MEELEVLMPSPPAKKLLKTEGKQDETIGINY